MEAQKLAAKQAKANTPKPAAAQSKPKAKPPPVLDEENVYKPAALRYQLAYAGHVPGAAKKGKGRR